MTYQGIQIDRREEEIRARLVKLKDAFGEWWGSNQTTAPELLDIEYLLGVIDKLRRPRTGMLAP